ncbi:MAG: ROK family protein [Anaerolineae bacterium]|nr:ROK family protein [Anaerolineae bacterium]
MSAIDTSRQPQQPQPETQTSTYLAGVDIGGTKCAVSIGRAWGNQVDILDKRRFATPATPQQAMDAIINDLDELMRSHPAEAIGISCGGPLNSRQGVILSPPNLPHWDHVDVVTPLKERFGIPVALQNDANAGAIAEWKWGAGRDCENVIFLTFGTGMGAGLILNGKLYTGTNDMAGEIGHVRMESDGPIGYGKAGSFEGYCSGNGIAQLARTMAQTAIREGKPPIFALHYDVLSSVTAENVGAAAQQGDPLALRVFEIVADKLGRGLAMLVDILNPQRIIIGSIYGRQRSLLEPRTLQILREEAIPYAGEVCQIVPAELGESIGDLASLSVALNLLETLQPQRSLHRENH